MKIVWVATKSPWPPSDGGRLVLKLTVEALASRGHEIVVACPGNATASDGPPAGMRLATVREARRSWARAGVRALAEGIPISVARHESPRLEREVRRLAADGADLVFAEQLQSLPACSGAFEKGIPVILRSQNVESDLWRSRSQSARWGGLLLKREAKSLAEWERREMRRCARVIALTTRDASRLQELAGELPVVQAIPAPFPRVLPPADGALQGSPALVLFGSPGWWANVEGARWFLREIWPSLFGRFPSARLHLFGLRPGGAPPSGTAWHPAPAESRDAFAPSSIFVVPLRSGSGVRMKILEAWARGVPVIATPAASAGLEDDAGLLSASDAASFERALRRLEEEPALAAHLVAAGREALERFHDPASIARRIEDTARSAIARSQTSGGSAGSSPA